MTDRLIHVYIGTREILYLVSQVVLGTSSEYFVKAIKNERMGKNNVGVLRFPEDDEDAWELVLFWMIERKLPSAANTPCYEDARVFQGRLFNTWILADKYMMPRLQNATMTLLFNVLGGAHQCRCVALKALRDQNTSSVLRLACEGLVELAYRGDPMDGGGNPEDLSVLDGVPASVVAIAKAVEAFIKTSRATGEFRENGMPFRHWPDHVPGSELWNEFMVPE